MPGVRWPKDVCTWCLFVGAAVVTVVLTLALIATQSNSAHRRALCTLLDGVSCERADRGRLRYRTITGVFPFSYTVHGAAYAPDDGEPTIRAPLVHVRARPIAYLFGHGLVLEDVEVPVLEMLPTAAVPETGPDAATGLMTAVGGAPNTAEPPSWFSTAIAVRCHGLRIERLSTPDGRVLSVHGDGELQSNWTARARVYDADSGAASGDVIEVTATGDGGREWVTADVRWRLPAPLMDDDRVAGSLRLQASWRALALLSSQGASLGPADAPALVLAVETQLLARGLPRQPPLEYATGTLALAISGERTMTLERAAVSGPLMTVGAGVELSGVLGNIDDVDSWPQSVRANGHINDAAFGGDCSAAACSGGGLGVSGRLALGDGCLAVSVDVGPATLSVHLRPQRALPTTFGGLVDWLHNFGAPERAEPWDIEMQSSVGSITARIAPGNYSILSINGRLSAGALGVVAWDAVDVAGDASGVRVTMTRPSVDVAPLALRAHSASLNLHVRELEFAGLWPARVVIDGGAVATAEVGAATLDGTLQWTPDGAELRLARGAFDLGLRQIEWAPDDDVRIACAANGVWTGRAVLHNAAIDGPWLEVAVTADDASAVMYEDVTDAVAFARLYAAIEPDSLAGRLNEHVPDLEAGGRLRMAATAAHRAAPQVVLELSDATLRVPDWSATEFREVSASAAWPGGAFALSGRHGEHGRLQLSGAVDWTLGDWTTPLRATTDSDWASADGRDSVVTHHVWVHAWAD